MSKNDFVSPKPSKMSNLTFKPSSKRAQTAKLLALLWQARATIKIDSGRLLIGPPQVAKMHGDQIRALKPWLVLAIGHCPECLAELDYKIETLPADAPERRDGVTQTGIHQTCPKGCFEQWKTIGD